MMEQTDKNKKKKVEFYKNRTVAQRLTAGVDFFQYNIKVLFKGILKIIIPISLVQAFFVTYYTGSVWNMGTSGSVTGIMVLLFLIFVLGCSLTYAYVASIMNSYYEDGPEDVGVKDSEEFTLFTIKTFFLNLISLSFVAALFIITIDLEIYWLIPVVLLFILFLTPLFNMMYYPMYFEDIPFMKGVAKGMEYGLKNWGSTLFILLISFFLIGVIYYLFLIPMYVGIALQAALSMTSASLLGGIFGLLGSFCGAMGINLGLPFLFLFSAFQYSALREKKEGISLLAKIEDFENL